MCHMCDRWEALAELVEETKEGRSEQDQKLMEDLVALADDFRNQYIDTSGEFF